MHEYVENSLPMLPTFTILHSNLWVELGHLVCAKFSIIKTIGFVWEGTYDRSSCCWGRDESCFKNHIYMMGSCHAHFNTFPWPVFCIPMPLILKGWASISRSNCMKVCVLGMWISTSGIDLPSKAYLFRGSTLCCWEFWTTCKKKRSTVQDFLPWDRTQRYS